MEEENVDSAMALLDLNEEGKQDDSQDTAELKSARTLRSSGRSKKVPEVQPEKRRTKLKPKRLDENSSYNAVRNYYLDKTIKKQSPSLETIFEEPTSVNGKLLEISHKKIKRMMNFNATPSMNKLKVKKRQMKAKKFGFKKNRKKMSMETFMEKLNKLGGPDE